MLLPLLRLLILAVLLAGCGSRTGLPFPTYSPPATTDPDQVAVATIQSDLILSPYGTVEAASTATASTQAAQPTEPPPLFTTQIATQGQWTFTARIYGPVPSPTGEQILIRAALNAPNHPGYMLVNEWRNYGLGYTVPQAINWQPDHFYYTNAPVVDGCGVFINASDLWVVSLTTGAQNLIRPPDRIVSLAISPNGRWLIEARADTLTLVDLTTTAEQQIVLATGESLGSFIWSTDSTQVFFAAAQNPCTPDWQHRILSLTLSTLQLTELLPYSDLRFVPNRYLSPHLIQLRASDGTTWQFSPITQILTPP